MDTAQWAQGIGVVKPMEGSNNNKATPPSMLERRARPQKDQALNCPRCNSTNTKFCYYNNYSLSQPRYFCKTCRRYWTEGGSLRNVPVGGGSRKNKRSTPSTSTTSSSPLITKNIVNKLNPDLTAPNSDFPNQQSAAASASHHQNPKIQQGQDLNLAYPPSEDYNKFMEVNNSTSTATMSAMELLKTGMTSCSSSRGLNLGSFMPVTLSAGDSSTMYSSSGFPNLQEFNKGSGGINFSVEGFENGYEGIQEGGNGARMLFPVEDLKQQVQNTTEFEHKGDSTGYWNGMLGGGSW